MQAKALERVPEDRRDECWFCGDAPEYVVVGPVPSYVVCAKLECVGPVRATQGFTTVAIFEASTQVDEFKAVLAEVLALHARKCKDYGSDEDPYENVARSARWGCAPWVGASIRMGDKEKRLEEAAKGKQLANETVEDSMRDNIVYGVIRLILYRRERGAA